jgi:hypothetical protein
MPIVGRKFPDATSLLMWAMSLGRWGGEFLVGGATGDDLCGDHDELAGCLNRGVLLSRAIGERIPLYSFVVFNGHYIGVGDNLEEANSNYRLQAGHLDRGRWAVRFPVPVQIWTHPVHGWRFQTAEEIAEDIYQITPGGAHAGETLGRCDFNSAGVLTGSEVIS